MSQIADAVSCFKSGFSCSQAVLSTYGEPLGLSRDTALKVAAAFGGGMAAMGETCGAVTGAMMVLGLKYGRCRLEDAAAKDKTYGLVKEFVKRFKSLHGSIVCRDLIGCDLSTPEGMQQAKEKQVLTTVCPGLVKDAAEILEELLSR